MDKERELAFNIFVQGFNYGIQYTLINQEISGTVIHLSYPLIEELNERFNNSYLDVLLREQDKKEKEGNKRYDWCYIHNEKMIYAVGVQDNYYCQKCADIMSEKLKEAVKKDLKRMFPKEKELKQKKEIIIEKS